MYVPVRLLVGAATGTCRPAPVRTGDIERRVPTTAPL